VIVHFVDISGTEVVSLNPVHGEVIKVCQWFSTGTPVSFTNKTDSHDITEILLKEALNTINHVESGIKHHKPSTTTF